MELKNPFTHKPGGEFGCEFLDQVKLNAWSMVIKQIDLITDDLDPKYHGNQPEVICQLAAAMVNAELLLLVNQSIQEGVMFLGNTNLLVASTISKVANKIVEKLP